ncbi:MAG: GNAT family N-acetyltransferase [Candidatus Woesearchaeota archaeon]
MSIQKTDVTIIRATPQHLKEIQRLNKLLFEKEYHEYDKSLNLQWTFGKEGTAYYKKHITAKNCCVLIALVDQKIVGYLCGGITTLGTFRKLPKMAQLENMFVLKKYRSQGIGAKLCGAFIQWCKNNRIKKLRVQTFAQNIRAIGFYRKNKFKDRSLILESDI